MNKKIKLIYFSLVICTTSILPQSQFQIFISNVNALPDSISKSAAIDSFINYARTQGIPFIESNTANYFLRGPYNTAEITGDFNEFSPYLDLTKLYSTDFFYYSDQYELNARLDYEFRVNGSVILNDPENPDSILGYYGYKSELAMPEYVQPWEIEYDPNIPHGTVVEDSIFSSIVNLTYQLKIYLPYGYSSSSIDYPTVYFQDGFSYTNWGSAINVLDNIIANEKIEPIIAVFVKPNDRNQEYAFGLRNQYRLFFVNELVPFIDGIYRTITLPEERLVLGDSYGGNISTLISYNHPDVFGNCGLQSAAFNPNSYEAYNLVVNGVVKDINFFSIWGSYDDRNVNLYRFQDSLIVKGYENGWLVLPEGHSSGLWRATVDIMLEYFFPYDPMPVELSSFTAKYINDNVKLDWRTETEVSNYGFDIERKGKVNQDWTKIGFIEGHGNTNSPKNYSFIDENPSGGQLIQYRLKQIDTDGKYEYSDIIEVLLIVYNFTLSQNFPNPFNLVTKINYQVQIKSFVKLSVYDVLGNEVAQLVNGEKEAGSYEVEFNAANLTSGTYFYQMRIGDIVNTKKMILLK